MSDQADVKVPIHPYAEGSPDLAHPNEWCREPRAHIKAKIEKRLPKVSFEAPVNLEKPRFDKGRHPRVRRQRSPELFRERFSVEFVREMRASCPPPPEWDVWIRDVIEPGVVESMRGRFMFAIHPAYRRWTLWEVVNTRGEGQACKPIMILCGERRDGYLPADLANTGEFEHLRGMIGDFKMPTRRDLEMLRENFDRRAIDGREVSVRQGSQHQNRLHDAAQKKAYEEKSRVMDDQVRDILSYGFRHIWRAANNGTKQWSNETIVPHMNPRKWRYEEKNGYRVKTRIEAHVLAAKVEEVANILTDITRTERGLRKNYEPSASVVAFGDRCTAPDADFFELAEEGRALLARIEAESRVYFEQLAEAVSPPRAAEVSRVREAQKVPA